VRVRLQQEEETRIRLLSAARGMASEMDRLIDVRRALKVARWISHCIAAAAAAAVSVVGVVVGSDVGVGAKDEHAPRPIHCMSTG